MNSRSVGFIGGGRVARILLGGFERAGANPATCVVSDLKATVLDALKSRFAGWCCYIFSADTELPRRIRLKATKRMPLFNGPLECRLYEYRLIAGSLRRPRNERQATGTQQPQ